MQPAAARSGGRAGELANPVEAAARQKTTLLRVVRMGFIILFFTVALLSLLGVNPDSPAGEVRRAILWPLTLGGVVVVAGLFLLIDYLTPRKKISTLFSILLGLMGAMLATIAIGFVIDLFVKTYDIQGQDNLVATFKVLLGIGLAYLGITTVLQTQDDFRLVIPYVEFAKQIRGTRVMLLDTSALIDGRVADLAPTNFIQSPIVIPHFVVGELQQLADSGDGMKRTKGRRGLDVISRLQRSPLLDVTIDETVVPGKAVDQMLVELAKTMPAMIVTTDVGLARVANIQHIPILNLNDLANALKPSLIPGQPIQLKLLKRGEQPEQGVGYLQDGTMVVVENGFTRIGEVVKATVTTSMQTSAGRLIFARIEEDAPPRREAQARPAAMEAPEPVSTNEASGQDAGGDARGEAPGEDEPPVDANGSESARDAGERRSPFPPKPPTRSVRSGTPRNPRR